MLNCKLNDLFQQHKPSKVIGKVRDYCWILQNMDPNNAVFQRKFASFFTLNPTEWIRNQNLISGTNTWMDGLTRKEVFFNLLDKYLKKGKMNAKYDDIINDLAKVPMKNGKGSAQISFASKILHVTDDDKPIVDQKVLLKLINFNSGFGSSVSMKKTGIKNPLVNVGTGKTVNDKINDAVKFYDDLFSYYPKLISQNKQYLADFDTWISTYDSSLPKISDTKKIDFWMWLA